MGALDSFSDKEVLAKTLYGENRGGGEEGMHSVANVIVNRSKNPSWWGDDIRSVCLKPAQFSCWNSNDPNYEVVINVTTEDAIYTLALDIADQAIGGTLEDITDGATYYFAKSMTHWPKWAIDHTPCADIAGQLFFNNVS